MPNREIVALILIAAAACGVSAHAADVAPDGGWIGWAYLGEGGDLPLRIWLEDGPDGLAARFDGVPWQQTGWPTEFALDGDRAVLTTATPKGSSIVLDGVWADGLWSGDAEIAGYAGRFELLHAPGLVPVDPRRYADVPGLYRMADGDVLIARALGWGEVVVRSLRTGEQRTLLPTGTDRFLTGPARYVPTPVEARYRFERDAAGTITAVVREDAAANTTVGERFALRTEEVVFVSDGVELAGQVTRPNDDRPRPGIVLLGGSNWELRDSHEFQVRNLAAMGYAVIHWDKRGFGESGGSDPVAFATTAADAVAAAARLRARGDVTRVGYLGISRGGWTAPLAVVRDPEAAFLILMVPPATSPARQEQGSRLAILRADGFGAADVSLTDRTLTAAWQFLASDSDADWALYAARRDSAAGRGIPDDLLPPADRDRQQWRWSRLNMLHDPLPVLQRIRVPVLAIFGEHDLSVLTAEQRPLLESALSSAGNDDVTVVTIAGVSHGLSRPAKHPVHRSTGVGAEGFDVILEWSRRKGP